MTRAPGWLPDPTRRHELRYWDGAGWTADVADGGAESFDPQPVPVTPPPDEVVDPAPPETTPAVPPADPAFDPASRIPAPSALPPPPGRARRALPFIVTALVAAAVVAVVLLMLSGDDGDDDDPSTAAGRDGSESTGSTSPGSFPEGADTAEEMVDSIVTGIREQTGDLISEEQAECMAEELVDEIGIDRLEELGDAVATEADLNPLGLLTDEEQAAALSRMRSCVDPATLGELVPDDG